MKNFLPVVFAFFFCFHSHSQAPTLTITNLSNSSAITCSTPSVNLLGALSNYTPVGTVVFSWTSTNTPIAGANVNITNPGSYTLTATDAAGNFSISSQVSISTNTLAPVTAVSPMTQNISCGLDANFSGSCNLPNITHYWTSPYSSGSAISVGFTSIYNPSAVGVFTYCVVDNTNGCSTCKTVTVTSSSIYPTYTAVSPSQFTLGCGTTSVTSVTIMNPSSTMGTPLTFTLLPPAFLGSYNPGLVTTYTVNLPGTYTVVVRDNTNLCETKIPISIIQNTVAPTILVSAPIQTLSCFIPGMSLTVSGTPNASYNWQSAPFGNFTGTTAQAVISANATSTIAGVFTITATDNLSTCKSTTNYTVLQNIFKPNVTVSGPNALTCTTYSVMLTASGTSGIPGPNPGFPVSAVAWYGPAPQTSLANTPSYIASTPGVYTVVVKDFNNGCEKTTTKVVGDNAIYLVVLVPPPITPNCLFPQADITATVLGSPQQTAPSYSWFAGSSQSIVTPSNTPQITVIGAGIYTVMVTNPTSGCVSTAEVTVTACSATGIHEQSLANQPLSVFPNPANNQVTVQITEFTSTTNLEIYSVSGVLISNQPVTSEKTTVDLQPYPAGIYFIYLREAQKTVKAAKILKN